MNMADQGITITIEGLDALRSKFAKFPAAAKKYIGQALDESGRVLLRYSQQATVATVPQKTGALRSAFKWQTNGLSGQLFIDPSVAPYGIFVHEGTKPHDIYPRTASVLAFNWTTGSAYGRSASGRSKYIPKQNLGTIFARHIRHPGTKARPFMPMIARQATPEILTAFNQAFGRMVREVQ